jgi:uncharacterized RDD family membrane protein YckC
MQTINVRTTQNVFIEYPVASLGDRVVANLLDSVIVAAYVVVAALVMDSVNGSLDNTAEWIAIATILLPALLYHLLFEIFMDGQSPGKRVMEIKVVRTDGTSPTIGNYVMRWILRLLEIRLFWGLIALVAIAAGGRGQRLGDMAAGTTVVKLVRERDATASEVFTLTHGQYNPVFHQVLALNDRDIELIQQAIHVYSETGNAHPMNVIGRKIETKLGITTEMEAINFLSQIIKDYAHLSAAK